MNGKVNTRLTLRHFSILLQSILLVSIIFYLGMYSLNWLGSITYIGYVGDYTHLLYYYALLIGLIFGFMLARFESFDNYLQTIIMSVNFFALNLLLLIGIVIVLALIFYITIIPMYAEFFGLVDPWGIGGSEQWLFARYLVLVDLVVLSIIGSAVGGLLGYVYNNSWGSASKKVIKGNKKNKLVIKN